MLPVAHCSVTQRERTALLSSNIAPTAGAFIRLNFEIRTSFVRLVHFLQFSLSAIVKPTVYHGVNVIIRAAGDYLYTASKKQSVSNQSPLVGTPPSLPGRRMTYPQSLYTHAWYRKLYSGGSRQKLANCAEPLAAAATYSFSTSTYYPLLFHSDPTAHEATSNTSSYGELPPICCSERATKRRKRVNSFHTTKNTTVFITSKEHRTT